MLRDITRRCVALETNKILQIVALELIYILVAITHSLFFFLIRTSNESKPEFNKSTYALHLEEALKCYRLPVTAISKCYC